MKLEEVRKEIDQIDEQMLNLFLRRMDAAAQVARIKAQTGQPIYNQRREQEILDEVTKKAGAYAAPAKILFQTMMDVSRALQHNLLGGGKELREQIEHADAAPLEPREAFPPWRRRISFQTAPSRSIPGFTTCSTR